MLLGVELDSVLTDLEGTLGWINEIYYDGEATPQELRDAPVVMPHFFDRTVRVRKGSIGALMRIKHHEPRLQIMVLTDRPHNSFEESKQWLRKWMPAHLHWAAYSTTDFGLIPAQVYVVGDKSKHPTLVGKPRVVESLADLGYGMQIGLDL